ncbi:hypothetical protein [Clostridium gasigenes]|uniref:Uncharacterized protein n=1 Tax=Clostridium gasigenes TaxID=94869 RepID=A0A1H0M5D4_9CLOT|nr:hypothetical protein [Clostridium gasigenes]SDO75577.1 hypothetical protein SAMN04488529_101326 [Clostridium gasigenes]
MEDKKETATEVLVQEQLDVKEKIYKITNLIEGLSLYEWDKLKNCIDREFKSQANKTTFKNGDRFKEILNLDIIQ